MNGEGPLAALKNPLTWLLIIVGLLSIVILNHLLREQPQSYRGVNHDLPGFMQRSEEDAKPSDPDEQSFSSLDYIQREVVPFAPIEREAAPVKSLAPAPPARTLPPLKKSDPAPKPAAPKPRLKLTKPVMEDSGSSISSSAFLPTAKDAKEKNSAPAPAATSGSKSAPTKTRSWRNPVGQSSTRP